MFVLGNFFLGLANVLDIAFNILIVLIFIRALISWVNPDPYNPIVQFLYKTTEPILQPLRNILPASFKFGIDISPILAFLVITFLRVFLVRTLFEIAAQIMS
ncbi:MAG: YggT family protein [Candidatus Omnitrophica bacterium]|nr:YggT family protein [Candidatus Omnitrophota bacterium]MBD3268756.1 YggT family protein [Candidatus Omnitrophota bacterium]